MTSSTRTRLRRVSQAVFLLCFFLLLLVFVDAPPGTDHLQRHMRSQWSPAYLLCLVDPLASLSAFVASRAFPALAVVPLIVVAFCLLIPRFFCSHACPMGTLIDLAGALRGRRAERSLARFKFIKYGVLAAVVLFAALALPVSGYLTPMPLLARGVHAAKTLADGSTSAHLMWLGALLAILAAAVVRRRFWCNYLCPTGALLSIVSRFSWRKRTKTDACTECKRCAGACSFDAVQPDTFDAGIDCAYCGACSSVCKAEAIHFGAATALVPVDPERRDFIAGACVAGGLLAIGGPLAMIGSDVRLRPPGALPEDEFLARCIRCGVCAQNCPGPAISIVGLAGGLAGYGTPEIVPERAGCAPRCNTCGRVCPTGAITHLPLKEKKAFVMGTARHCKQLCLPHREEENCLLCYNVCHDAGYEAIELKERIVYLDDLFDSLEENRTVLMIPNVNKSKCVGCGLCVAACMRELVKKRGKLPRPAILVDPKSNNDQPVRKRARHRRGDSS
ncbi:MAG: 4Fe-4S binding protein [Planctomycetes bacterium]|nr:4Fe-4S binding protein [Planctomycetota bacterium]